MIVRSCLTALIVLPLITLATAATKKNTPAEQPKVAPSSPPSTQKVPPLMQKTNLVLGTATPGGGFPFYGDALAASVNETDQTFNIETRNTKGSAENIPLLEEGKLDI